MTTISSNNTNPDNDLNISLLLLLLILWFSRDIKKDLHIGGHNIRILFGWFIEQLAINVFYISKIIGSIILIVALSSSIACRSLRKGVLDVLKQLTNDSAQKNIKKARKELSKIVGRDVEQLTEVEILRATAETASEKSVDGIFI